MTMKTKSIWLVPLIAAAIVLYESAFVVSETELVVITQLGKIVREPIQEPGLHLKLPFIEKANFFPKNILEWDGDPGQIPTLDKTFIWVEAFARWKIVDPVKFFQTVNNRLNAVSRLNDIIDPAVRNFITSHKLIDAVRKSNRELDTSEIGMEDQERKPQSYYVITIGREKITQGILEQAQPKLAQFGIELVDVKIKSINYVEEVRKSVYDRMIAERKQIAEKFRSEGKGEAQRVLGQRERDMQQITSEAYRVAEEVKGKADGEAAKIYAEAYGIDPDFYAFTRTLEIYNDSLTKDASLLLTTDSEFLKYFKGLGGKTK